MKLWHRRRPAEMPIIGDDFDAQLAVLEQGTLILARGLREDVVAGELDAGLAEQLVATFNTQMATIRSLHEINQNLHGILRELINHPERT